MRYVLPLLAAAAAVTGAASVSSAQTGPTNERINRIIVYGDDPCPRSANGDIVVCARRPDNERYRIPENLRDGERVKDGESWAARSESLEYVGRAGIQSCSTVGPGGFTGCWAEMMRQASKDRRSNPQPRADR